ncbi:YkgJ family cysteine cluster protein [Sphingomonas sp. CJ20]
MNRADRRRQEKEDERNTARGLNIEERDPAQVMALTRLVHREVLTARTTGRVTPVLDLLLRNLAKTDSQAPHDLVACRKGCSHCCKMWVSATAPEIFHLARAVRAARLDVADIVARCGTTQGLSFETRQRIIGECPLLSSDGSCSVYAARPMVCRTAASADAEVCRRGYLEMSGEDVPTPMFFMFQRTGYLMALRGAFLQAGLRLETYEMNEALAVALAVEDAERRWLRGEDVFAGVQQDPGPNPVDDPASRWFLAQAFGSEG